MTGKFIKYISAIVATCIFISCFYVTYITSSAAETFKELTLADFGLEDMELLNMQMLMDWLFHNRGIK